MVEMNGMAVVDKEEGMTNSGRNKSKVNFAWRRCELRFLALKLSQRSDKQEDDIQITYNLSRKG